MKQTTLSPLPPKTTLAGSFRHSFQELKSLRSLLVAAMLLAIHTVLSIFVSIQVTESLRISISFLANVLAGCLFGPVIGLLNGALGDILQFLIKPMGGYFFGWTLNAALAGLIYGLAFYGRLPQHTRQNKEHFARQNNEQFTKQNKGQFAGQDNEQFAGQNTRQRTWIQRLLLIRQYRIDLRYLLRTLLAVTIVGLFVNALLGTYWCTILYGKHFMVYFTPRFFKNLFQIPINTILVYSLLQAMASVPEFRRLGKNG